MRSFIHTVQDQLGIHARPAGQLVKKASQFSSSVTLTLGDKKCDGRKVIALMMLGAKMGDEITIWIEGADEEIAEQELKEYLNENL